MKILLTNDDGIYAPGLFALYQALKSDHELTIVAPESEMSAVGHAITLTLPLRVQEVKKYNAGLIENDDLDGTIKLLEKWLKMPASEKKLMKKQAAKCFEENFEINKIVESLMRLLNKK